MAKMSFDAQMVARTVKLIHRPESIIEIRMPKSGRFRTVSGYFDKVEALVKAVGMYAGKAEVPGIYFTLNACDPALLARCANTLKPYADTTTSDADIIRRGALGIDFDPKRPAKISSTDIEHTAAIAQAEQCRAWLSAMGWPDPLFSDSGNGGHLVYGLDLPNDAEITTLLEQALQAMAHHQGTAEMSVDTTVFNAARIWKLYGTMARKGSDITERPHRLAQILEAPDMLSPVSRDLLQALEEMAPKPRGSQPPRQYAGHGARTINAEQWLETHGIEVLGTKLYQGGTLYKLKECPWNPDHTNNDARLIQWPNGALEAGCFHNSCKGKGWRDLRELYEPHVTRKPYASNGQGVPSQPAQHPQPPMTEDDESIHLTDRGNAIRLVLQSGKNLHYVHLWRKWLVWRGGRWVLDDVGNTMQLAKRVITGLYGVGSKSH